MSNFMLVISLVTNISITHTVEGPMNLWDCTVREQEIRQEYINKVGITRAATELSALCYPIKG